MKTAELEYQIPKASWFQKMLWACAGGDRFLLQRATYSDQVKYMCLGGIVLATGMMAGLAGGYAFYTIFSPKDADVLQPSEQSTTLITILSVLFGIIWGAIILNIDRFIVAATGKGDGTENITKQEFLGAIPRIIMGTIIAITISKPIEIRMFKGEIDAQLAKYQLDSKEKSIEKVKKNYDTKRKDVMAQNQDLQNQIKNLDSLITKQAIDIDNEIMGRNTAGRGYGNNARDLERRQNETKARRQKLLESPEYMEIQEKLKNLEKNEAEEIAREENKAAAEDGLLRRIQLADEVASTDIDGVKHFPWITTFITLLFLAIELTPVFFKLMLVKSPYDYMKDNLEDEIRARDGIEVKYDYYKDKKGLERHLVINHDAENMMYEKVKLSEIQRELTEYAVQKYKEREMQNIDENLDDYISKNV
ncbi:DUF4407 domain-containing protein [Cruoricaptor ignavus]|uniref:DUF4407 domain-containing protein n=1 Tax=Cruoricaptor ignavus TaxID=1118202 RepID=UPI00370D36F5